MLRARRRLTIGSRVAALLALLTACETVHDVPEEPLPVSSSASFTRRSQVRAFYSGHSLTDGVPEAVASIASSLGDSLQFEQQSLPGSLLRERTKGKDTAAPDFPGYKTGRNRNGQGLDVERELSMSRPSAERYQALVVTERHDLPWAAAHESTAHYLQHIVTLLARGNPQADVFLYHGWLDVDLDNPAPWIRYERAALRLWECVASAANQELTSKKQPARIQVLPGATALAALVEQLHNNAVPGFDGDTRARMKRLFRDNVHLTPLGIYYMGLVHYAVLFGRSPEGAYAPDLPADTVLHLQRLAYQSTRAYAPLAQAAAHRDPNACADYAARHMCGAFYALRGQTESGPLSALKRLYHSYECANDYGPKSPRNPFILRTVQGEASSPP